VRAEAPSDVYRQRLRARRRQPEPASGAEPGRRPVDQRLAPSDDYLRAASVLCYMVTSIHSWRVRVHVLRRCAWRLARIASIPVILSAGARRCEIAIAHRSSHAPAHASRHPAVRHHSTCSTHANASPAKVDGRSLSADGGSYLESSARTLFLVTWPPACYAITALFSESPFMKS
jgi:hypothetical protein